ncbi:MAG: gamma-glutamyltransferase [Candidatus Competibacteraceae bacterium]
MPMLMKSAVASGHERVTEAACEILQAGGNAFDAAIAGGFAAAVAEPALTSLGGGGFLLARTAEGATTLFDFFVDTPGRGLAGSALEPHFVPVTVRFPASEQVFNAGLGSAAVPGNLRGYLHVHRRLGRLPLKDVLTPATQLAREGLALNGHQSYFLDLLRPIMTLTPAGCELFQPDERYLTAGDRFANPGMAAFLDILPSEGEREFYQGAIARRIVEDMQAGQGLITLDDLATYQVIERKPLTTAYRDYQLLTNPPPSFGGTLVALSLQLLEAQDIGTLDFGSARHLCFLAAVMQEVDRLRAQGYLTSAEFDTDKLLTGHQRALRTASSGTTQLSVCDTEGNVASMTTSNGEGSGYIVPGTGIMLNNMLGEDDLHPDGFHAASPGVRVASMMAPSLLLHGDRVQLVLGSGGSKRIRTALLQVLSHVIDFGMAIEEAIGRPRLHWDGQCLQVEPAVQEQALAALEARWPLNRWPVQDVYFGGVNAVAPTGAAGADARRGGNARVL